MLYGFKILLDGFKIVMLISMSALLECIYYRLVCNSVMLNG